MLKKSSLRSFIWWYSFYYWFCRFLDIHSFNNFPLLVRVCVPVLSLPMERYKSKDISIMKRAIKKWPTSHESSRQAHFHHINIFFLEVLFGLQNPNAPWMVSTTVILWAFSQAKQFCKYTWRFILVPIWTNLNQSETWSFTIFFWNQSETSLIAIWS